MNDEFQEYWRANFPNCPPVSYLFKQRLNHLWFRIHSLPESKRYAENAKETHEILRRQKLLFNDVIGEDADCFMVCLGFNENPVRIYEHEFPILGEFLTHEAEPVPLLGIDENREEDEIFRLALGRRKINFDDLTEIFAAIADREIAHFFILNSQSKRIFAPYDGGVDVILESSSKRDEFKIKYQNWLSSHPQGF